VLSRSVRALDIECPCRVVTNPKSSRETTEERNHRAIPRNVASGARMFKKTHREGSGARQEGRVTGTSPGAPTHQKKRRSPKVAALVVEGKETRSFSHRETAQSRRRAPQRKKGRNGTKCGCLGKGKQALSASSVRAPRTSILRPIPRGGKEERSRDWETRGKRYNTTEEVKREKVRKYRKSKPAFWSTRKRGRLQGGNRGVFRGEKGREIRLDVTV